MDVFIKNESQKEGIIEVNLAEKDYINDLKTSIDNLFKTYTTGKYNRLQNGFRHGKYPKKMIYDQHGYDILCRCCMSHAYKALEEFIKNNDKLNDVNLLRPLLISTGLPRNNQPIDYAKPGDMNFIFAYAIAPELNIDNIEDVCKTVKLTQYTVSKVNESKITDMLNMLRVKNCKYVNIFTVTDPNHIIFLRNIENSSSKQIVIPAQGCTIDGEPLNLMGKSVGDKVDIKINDIKTIFVDKNEYNSYFDKYILMLGLKNGENHLVVEGIKAISLHNLDDKFCQNLCINSMSKVHNYSHNMNLGVDIDDDQEYISVEEMTVEKYKHFIKTPMIINANHMLERLSRLLLRDAIVKAYENVEIPTQYMRYKIMIDSLRSNTNDSLYRHSDACIKNTIIWKIICDSIAQKHNIVVTDEEVKNYSRTKVLFQNNDNLFDKLIIEETMYGLDDEYGTPSASLRDIKVCDFLVSLSVLNKKNIDYDEYISMVDRIIAKNIEKNIYG
jgi:FKBP-type peptidyl-prolyl cis-trans isomerase (trigger factor)